MEDILLGFNRCYNLPEFVAGDVSRLFSPSPVPKA